MNRLAVCIILQAWLACYVGAQLFGHGGRRRGNYNNNNYNNYYLALTCPQKLADCQAVSNGNLATILAGRVVNGQTLTTLQDLLLNFDLNNNQCLEKFEFINVLTSRGFSVQYATFRFTETVRTGLGFNATACPGSISVATLGTQPASTATADTINNANVQSMIGFCDANTQLFRFGFRIATQTRYRTSCECIQLPTVCNSTPFSTTNACINFRAAKAIYPYCPFVTTTTTTTTTATTTPTSTQIQQFCQTVLATIPATNALAALCLQLTG